jgi:hypothetical protein
MAVIILEERLAGYSAQSCSLWRILCMASIDINSGCMHATGHALDGRIKTVLMPPAPTSAGFALSLAHRSCCPLKLTPYKLSTSC